MSAGAEVDEGNMSARALLSLAGSLLLGGFLAFFIVTLFHPAGQENNHPIIFAKYAQSDPWVAVHFGQFIAVLIALGGLLVLCRVLGGREGGSLLARCAAGTTVATAASWALLQAIDGVTLKHAVDAWASASPPAKSARFADAETVRWAEWGIQAYYRLLLGLTLLLLGGAIARTGMVPRWLGGVAILAGLLYMAIGVAVGHSGFEQPGDLVFQLLLLTFVGGLLASGLRRGEVGRD